MKRSKEEEDTTITEGKNEGINGKKRRREGARGGGKGRE